MMSESNSGGKGPRQDAIDNYAPQFARNPGDAIEGSPLVALAAGVAAGALVAALLPVTCQERKLARPVGERVTNAARGAADAARKAGSDKLRELGLTPDAVAEKVTEAGRATAQAAIGAVRDDSASR